MATETNDSQAFRYDRAKLIEMLDAATMAEKAQTPVMALDDE